MKAKNLCNDEFFSIGIISLVVSFFSHSPSCHHQPDLYHQLFIGTFDRIAGSSAIMNSSTYLQPRLAVSEMKAKNLCNDESFSIGIFFPTISRFEHRWNRLTTLILNSTLLLRTSALSRGGFRDGSIEILLSCNHYHPFHDWCHHFLFSFPFSFDFLLSFLQFLLSPILACLPSLSPLSP